jgi:alpha-beta hydrolase superfamily lysophospholipase
VTTGDAVPWGADPVLAGHDAVTVELEREDDGPLVATLVRHRAAVPTRRAVLYLHGFVDYYFQTHVAEALAARGWDFYALELRRYGRSLRPGNRPYYCTDLAQYDEEIDTALGIVRDEGHETIVLLGHSTGGLVATWYAHRGPLRALVQGLVLNSPFFSFAVKTPRRFLLPVASLLGRVMPWGADPQGLPPNYGHSLLAEHRGEWTYSTRWKPVTGFPIYFGWVRAIRQVQAVVERGLDLAVPVLLLHAEASRSGAGPWHDDMLARDIVLDVEDMRRVGPTLGPDVTLRAIPQGMHDLFLSRPASRALALDAMLGFLSERFPAAAPATP